MSQVWAIILAKLRIGKHQVGSVRHESKLKVGVITVAAFVLWFSAFILFFKGFEWIIDFGHRLGGDFNFGDLLMGRLLGILALSVFILLVFSNVLVSFSTMYRSKEVIYLLQGPITFEQFFYARFFECVSFSSWSIAFLGSPLILAYGLATGASPVFYLAALVFFLPYVIIPACIGCILTMLLVRIFPLLKVRVMFLLGVLAVLVVFYYLRGVIQTTNIDEDTLLPAFLDASARLQSPLMPSHWAAQGVLDAAQARFGTSLYYFGLLFTNALFALWLTGQLAQWIFYPGWSYLMGQDRQRIKPMDKGVFAWLEPALRPIRDPQRTLIMKDIKLFWRDPTQWSQFVIFFGIMAIYIANLRNTSRYYEEEFWRSWIACLNVGAVTLILATLTSRFVFPLISLEGRRFWILGLAPLTYKQLIWQKFWLSVLMSSIFTVSLAALSAYMLQLEPAFFVLTVYSVIVCNFGLAGLAVGLGTLYPTFTEDNPARIVSGMGGTLNLLVSIGYITLVVAAQVLVFQGKYIFTIADAFSATARAGESSNAYPGMELALAAALVFITALSVACVFVPMHLGLKNLKATEF